MGSRIWKAARCFPFQERACGRLSGLTRENNRREPGECHHGAGEKRRVPLFPFGNKIRSFKHFPCRKRFRRNQTIKENYYGEISKVGLIGSGSISYTYLNNLTKTFSITDVVGCSDLIPDRSASRAEEFGIRQMTNEEIFSDPEIEIVVNTTYPMSHYKISKQAMEAGKHVYAEKMMATNFENAKELYDISKKKGSVWLRRRIPF